MAYNVASLSRPELLAIRRARHKYGDSACIAAFKANEEGWGPSGILHWVSCGFPFRTVGQVDAAINAGRFIDAIRRSVGRLMGDAQ